MIDAPRSDVRLQLADTRLLKEQAYIDGKFVGEPVDAVEDPATGTIVGRVPRLGTAEATAAVEAAATAFPSWSRRPAKERSQILRRWFDLISASSDDLARLLTAEQGKPFAEAQDEIRYGAAYVEYYAEEAKRVRGEILPSHRADARIMVACQPVGVVAAITPWNFPHAMITRKVAPALAAGCAVVVKPAPETPLSAIALCALAEQAGIPPGVLNIITGDAEAIGQVLTSHPAVRLLSFTGSTEVGKRLMRQCASTVKKLALELGGNAPALVFDDADLDVAVDGVMTAKFRNSGQTCVCANRIYVQDRIHDDFVERLAARVATLTVGAGTEAGVTQGPLINCAAVTKVEGQLADAIAKGGRIVAGGRRHRLGRTFFEPTIVTGATHAMMLAQNETFGPIAPIFRFQSERDVIAAANATTSGLAAYMFTRSLDRIFRVSDALECGMVGINTGSISTELAPFGGVKESGHSREGSHDGIEEYLEKKYLLVASLDAVPD